MASAVDFAGIRRRRSPFSGAFFTPADVTNLSLLQTLVSISRDMVTAYSSRVKAFPFQRINARALLLKVKILLPLFEYLKESSFCDSSVSVCLKELYILIYKSRLLLEYCDQSGKLWILLLNCQISGTFHDLNQEIATILDVFPIRKVVLCSDLREQVQLLCRQCRRSKLYVDSHDELLRRKIFSFLNEFEKGRVPDCESLKSLFIDGLGIINAKSCRNEIKFLEEQIFCGEEDLVDASVLGGVVALMRYCRFLLFGFVEEGREVGKSSKKSKRRASFNGSRDISVIIPKDFCCPISLDLMQDPVIISTGQTYDRLSITQWMEEGHNTCPNSGQVLAHTRVVPNKALRNLISQWCFAQGIHYDHLDCFEFSNENVATAASSRSAIGANRATARLLVRKLDNGSENEITVAARELRMLAKTGKENRACIAEIGAIPFLQKLLSSSNHVIQENSVTALLNLSIHDINKSRIVEQQGCLKSITAVLRHGQTTEAKENAAATLFSLSAVHDYKKRISDEPGAVSALAQLLTHGSQRGKKDAVTALFNLSTHPGCFATMIDSGAVQALVEALAMDEVIEEAAGALALLMRQKIIAEVIGKDEMAISGLLNLMRRGSPKAKENAVSALNELCKSGGAALTQRIAQTPSLGGLLQQLLFTGTKRARRKAASLARMCQKCEMEARQRGVEYAMTRSSSVRRSSSFVGGDVSVSVAVSVL